MGMILNFAKWQKLHEQANTEKSGISNVRSKVAFVGSTPSKTSNATALAEFKKAFPEATVTGEIDETKALFKKEANTKRWETRAKTQTAKDYLKVGDRILNGDSERLSVIAIESSDLVNKPVEASGNGIFALGRALAMRKGGQKVFEGKLIIGMNTKTADSFLANADTAFQNPIGDFRRAALFTFVPSKAVIPGAGNTTDNVKLAITRDIKTANAATNKACVPKLPKEYLGSAQNVNPIDATGFVDTIKEKQIKEWNPELAKYVEEYTNTFFESFVNVYAERFKFYLKGEANKAGIDLSLFSNLMGYIDEWKTTQNKDEYNKAVEKEIKLLFSSVGTGGSATKPAASTSTKVTKGTEGKIGQ
jgi:hypothetical protein